jgi:hypothetical protein
MRSVVDEFPFPIGNVEAQELMRILAGLYKTTQEALLVVEPLGIDGSRLPPNLSPLDLWHQLLVDLARHGEVRSLVEKVRNQFPNNPRRPFFDALVTDTFPTISAEPHFKSKSRFDDAVTDREALLFFDDLTIPVGSLPKLIDTLQKMMALAPSVCLLKVKNPIGIFFGTGFRVSKGLLLTNHHVLFPENILATEVRADFGFDIDAKGASLNVVSLLCSVQTIKGEKAHDWATVEVPDMYGRDWPIIPLEPAIVPKVGDLAYILQHPGGQQKRLGFVRNMISDVDDFFLRYLTDTQPGSSGSPVFDSQGHLIALHHAGGQPMKVAGKPPVSKNEGIRISKIFEALHSHVVIS